MSWTDERVETLKKLWAEGQSASQIANELGGVTRNAVIGKVHRLGLASRAQPKAEAKAAEPAAKKPAKPKPVEAPAAAAPPPPPPPPQPRPVAARPPQVRPGFPHPPAPSEPLVDLVEVDAAALKLSLMELNERTCKWPIGDPSKGEFYFCGHPAAPGKPYCSSHVAAAYQPMSSRRDRERNRARAAIGRTA